MQSVRRISFKLSTALQTRKKNTNVCRVRDAGLYLQIRKQTDENWHESGPQKFRHTIFDKKGAIL